MLDEGGHVLDEGLDCLSICRKLVCIERFPGGGTVGSGKQPRRVAAKLDKIWRTSQGPLEGAIEGQLDLWDEMGPRCFSQTY